MKQQYAALIALLEKLPHLRSSENLTELERVTTDYEMILDQVHQTNDYYKTHTKSCLLKVAKIESDLREAKYGNSEKQREVAFKDAKQGLYEAMDALATLLKESPAPAGIQNSVDD